MTERSTLHCSRSRIATAGASMAAIAIALSATPAFAATSAAPSAADLLRRYDIALGAQIAAQQGEAQPSVAPSAPEPQSDASSIVGAPESQAVHTINVAAPDPQILIANPGTPTTARDPVNITGIGQMFVNAGGGSVGLCTGTLINPRMVIFAAHCVNTRAAGAYGANTGGTPIAFGFEANTRANGPGQVDELLQWFIAGPNQNRTNVAQALYNANYVNYNPLSLDPNSCTGPTSCFLIGDIAVASLDTPTTNIPTWALLFSQLPAVPITAAGTGYHVALNGYGNNGTGQAGVTGGIDFRRRIAENTLGALASLDEFENFLFGGASATNPQNLYWIDFDDPRRGTAAATPFDFNAWRDNALPNEGLTSGGDSGGPLVLDRAFAKSVILGVLSGGYTRFFGGQPANSYGTAAFYQPLYLYWDWIAANNPFHYVGSVDGNADWTDPTHWITNLDPNYQIIVGGALVNGIPGDVGTGNTDTPGFGQACFQTTTFSDCLDIASGAETINGGPIGSISNNAGQASIVGADGFSLDTVGSEGLAAAGSGRGTLSAQAGQTTQALPPLTLASGLPGATGFVPNNFDGDRVARVNPRYFDVTLGAAGTTTLGSTVVIDRFTVAHGGAMLDIRAAGSLTSLISITQMTGTMQVNGVLMTPGDYFMLAGGLNGTGVITTPFFTSTAGTISPGTTGAAGTIGTLTFRGNTIFASGTTLMIDLGAAGASDLINVQTGAAGSGFANLGGRVLFSLASGTTPRAGDSYTFLTAQNGISGTFATPSAISAILTPTLRYTANSVSVQLSAGTYVSVVDPTSAVQTSYAALMDGNRATNYGPLSALFGPLDLQNQATIRAFFESIAPRTESTRTALGVVATGTVDRFFRQRVHSIEPGSTSGEVAVSGNPIALASSNGLYRADSPLAARFGLAEDSSTTGRLPDDMSGYLVGGYLRGSSLPMPALASAARDSFDGWYIVGGLEKAAGANATVGIGLSYADLDATTGGVTQQAGSRLIQGTLYGALQTDHGLRADFRISAGSLSTDTSRVAVLVTTPYTLTLDDASLAVSSEAGVGFDMAHGGAFTIVPRASIRYEVIAFDRAAEVGGPMALTVERDSYEALEGRVGVSLGGKADGKIRPFLEANYVHNFLSQPTAFAASFIGGVASAPFALAATDHDWGEVIGGISFGLG
ncbi:MAG: autotransporter domain-containing protein, partial [Sphingopyxis sp.]